MNLPRDPWVLDETPELSHDFPNVEAREAFVLGYELSCLWLAARNSGLFHFLVRERNQKACENLLTKLDYWFISRRRNDDWVEVMGIRQNGPIKTPMIVVSFSANPECKAS